MRAHIHQMIHALGRMARLARWLGPWAADTRVPGGIERRELSIPAEDGRQIEAQLYRPTRIAVSGAWALAPGLHVQGPDDPRMDRFARVLASSGCLVLAPKIADYTRLHITERAIADFQRAVHALLSLSEYPVGRRPWLFSISFGSLLALRAASSSTLARRIGGVVLFGGFCDWRTVMRFTMTGGRETEHWDPLNRPVVLMNMLDEVLDHAGVAREHAAVLVEHWLRFARETWSRSDRPPLVDTYQQVARSLAEEVPEPARELYLMGCGATPGGTELCDGALAQFDGSHMEVRSYLTDVRCPVHIAHGADDDVIPVTEAHRLDEAFPEHVPHSVHVTGFYGHTAREQDLLRALPTLVGEVATLGRLLRAIASA